MGHWLPAYPSTRAAVATISDQTIEFGAFTLANAGGAKAVDSLGNEVDITAVSGVSGTTSGWTHSSGRLIRTTGTPAASDGAVLSCTTALGTINVTISTIADAYSAATAAEIKTVIDLSNGSTTALSGKSLYLRPGSYDTRDNTSDAAYSAGLRGTFNYDGRFLNMTGTFTVRPHGAALSSTLNFWKFFRSGVPSSDRTGDVTFRDINFVRTVDDLKTQMVAGLDQNAWIVQLSRGTPSRNVSFIGCRFSMEMAFARFGTFVDYAHRGTAISVQSAADTVTIQNCLFERLGFGFNLYGPNWLVEGNEFRYAYGDFCNPGPTGHASLFTENFTIRNNTFHDITTDGVYHPDFIQAFGSGSDDVGPGVIEGNIVFPGPETNISLTGSIPTLINENGSEQNAATYTVVSGDNGTSFYTQRPDPSGNAYTLPAASTSAVGFTVSFCKANGTAVPLVVSPAGADTINGSATPITLTEWYESVRIVRQSASNWTAVMDDAANGFCRKFADFTVASTDFGRIYWVDASAGNVTVTLPSAASMTSGKSFQVIKTDSSTNTVTLDLNGSDTYTARMTGTPSVNPVLTKQWASIQLRGAGTSVWTEEQIGPGGPQSIIIQSIGSGAYKDIVVRGNIFWQSVPRGITFDPGGSTTVEGVQIYNNTVLLPIPGDINGDGYSNTYADAFGIEARPYINFNGTDKTTFAVRNITHAIENLENGFSGFNNTTIQISPLSTYTDLLSGDDTATDFFPLTKQQAIDMARPRSAANAMYGAVGTTNTNGYWNFSTGAANTITDAPTIVSSVPVDGSLSMPDNYNIVINFSHPIEKGTGNIVLRQNNSGWSDVETFDAASSARLTWDGNKLTIDPTSNLTAGREYAVRIASTAVVSTIYGTTFAGIANDTTLSFTAIAAPSQNLVTGSNTFDGTAVWANYANDSDGTTSAGGSNNSVTGEPYTSINTTGAVDWRYDSSVAADANWTPAGSTEYTFSIYVKKGASASNFTIFFRTLGGTDQQWINTFNNDTGAFGTPSVTTLTMTEYNTTADLGSDERRIWFRFTTPAGTNRILWELRLPSATNNVLVSSSKINAGGLDAYSPGY